MIEENEPRNFYKDMPCPDCDGGVLRVFGDPEKVVVPHELVCDNCSFRVRFYQTIGLID